MCGTLLGLLCRSGCDSSFSSLAWPSFVLLILCLFCIPCRLPACLQAAEELNRAGSVVRLPAASDTAPMYSSSCSSYSSSFSASCCSSGSSSSTRICNSSSAFSISPLIIDDECDKKKEEEEVLQLKQEERDMDLQRRLELDLPLNLNLTGATTPSAMRDKLRAAAAAGGFKPAMNLLGGLPNALSCTLGINNMTINPPSSLNSLLSPSPSSSTGARSGSGSSARSPLLSPVSSSVGLASSSAIGSSLSSSVGTVVHTGFGSNAVGNVASSAARPPKVPKPIKRSQS